jgi:hypothetical protein
MGLFGKKAEPEAPPAPGPSSGANLPGPRTGAYGIEETIRLMRTLPVEQNLDLVVGVVKSTLESMNVRLSTIIEDAAHKQQTIEQRIAGLKGEIGELEKEIAKRRQEIDGLEQDLAETTKVRERLERAETSARPPLPPPAQAPSRSHRPIPPPPVPAVKAKGLPGERKAEAKSLARPVGSEAPPDVTGEAKPDAAEGDDQRKTIELK